jgi:ribosome biogenesis GTPase
MDPAVPGELRRYGWSERVEALFAGLPASPAVPGRVVRAERSQVAVVGPDGRERLAVMGGPATVGDWVTTGETGVVDVVPRWSELSRLDPSGRGRQVLAANVDLVFITAPADRMNAGRVERELAVAWESGARPVVVVTKADLDEGPAAADLAGRLLGVEVVAVSGVTGAGLERLVELLAPDRTAVLLGPSGAGKSTLANALTGAATQSTGAVRAVDARGRHTTTSRQVVALPGGGVLIDTPGLRAIGMTGAVDAGLAFPEIAELLGRCRFSDCRHASEPGCAITGALAAGELDPERVASWRKLAGEAESERRREDSARRAGPPPGRHRPG